MSETLALLTEAEKLARVTDAVTAAYAVELKRVLRDLERELQALVLQAREGSRTALAKTTRAAALRKQIRDALRAAGYDDLASRATSKRLDRLLAQVQQVRGAAKLAAFTSRDMTRVLGLQALAKLDVLGQGDQIAFALWRTLVQGLYSQRPVRDLLQDLADAIDVAETEARTLYDTTVSVFSRQVEAMKTTPEDVFAYVGPVDGRLRPFCRQHVGKVYTREEIDAMDNGQLPDVYLTAGGYNCRHGFHAISKASALRDLVGTDARMPEVAARLKTIPIGGKKAA